MKSRAILAVMVASIACGTGSDERPAPAAGGAAPTASSVTAPADTEAKAREDYVSKIVLTKVAARRTVGNFEELVALVDGQIKNTGDRGVEKVDVAMYFLNRAGEHIKEETSDVLSSPLKPNETRKWTVAVRLIPDDWSGKVDAKVSRVQLAPR